MATASNPQAPAEPPFATLLRMIRGFQISKMIYVAAQLGIADLVTTGAKTSDELAAATGTNAAALYRLLRALASIGIFAEDEQGRFGLTPLAQPLQKDAPNSMYAAALYHGDPIFQSVWNDLLNSVTTGEDGYQHLYGMSSWAYREQHPEFDALFNGTMTNVTRMDTGMVLGVYDFSKFGTLVDVAGGHGALLAAILKINPTMRGVLFDLPHVLSGAQSILAGSGVAERCELVSGDFFKEVPAGDAYILKNILHDWDDADSIRILQSCRRAIKPDGKLLLIGFVIPAGNTPHLGKILDITMLVALGGRERTEQEYRSILSQSGFNLSKVIPTPDGRAIIEVVPV